MHISVAFTQGWRAACKNLSVVQHRNKPAWTVVRDRDQVSRSCRHDSNRDNITRAEWRRFQVPVCNVWTWMKWFHVFFFSDLTTDTTYSKPLKCHLQKKKKKLSLGKCWLPDACMKNVGRFRCRGKTQKTGLLFPRDQNLNRFYCICCKIYKPTKRTLNINVYGATVGIIHCRCQVIWHDLNNKDHALGRVTFKSFITISIRKL